MATQGESRDYEPGAGDAAHPLESSLRDAMDNDPRLSSGLGGAKPENVLDFIQMTGLTARHQGGAWDSPGDEQPDDPVSFFEYGVRDVDGSADPEQIADLNLDLDAFTVSEPPPSQTLQALQSIIADLGADADRAIERAPEPSSETDADAPDNEAAMAKGAPVVASPEPESRPGESASDSPVTDDAASAQREVRDDLREARGLLEELTLANEAAARTERHVVRAGNREHDIVSESAKTDTHEGAIESAEDRTGVPSAELPGIEDDDEFAPVGHGLPRRKRVSAIGAWVLRLVFLVALGGAGYGVWWLWSQQVRTPTSTFAAAERLLQSGRAEQAARAFVAFSERYPSHPARADALFNAAEALHATPPHPEAKAMERYEQAIALLQEFSEDYPGHEKVARAHTMIGILYHRIGHYDAAVNVLGDPDLRLRDPAAYLTALRTLGRAYAAMSQIDNARTAFLRAAALPENLAPDKDYVELAELYQGIASRSGDPERRQAYIEKAIEQWELALQVPGLLRSRKEDIQLLRDVAMSKLEGPGEAAWTGVGQSGEPAGTRMRSIQRGYEQGGPGARTSGTGDASEE